MLAFLLSVLKDKRKSVIIFSLSSVAFLEMYMATFPLLAKQADQFNEMMKMFPPELFKSFGINLNTLSFNRLESYLAMENYGMFWPVLMVIMVVGLAGYICANDIDRGTIEFSASLPVSRLSMFFGRYIGGLIAVAAFVFVSVYSVIPLAKIHNVSYDLPHYGVLAAGGFLFAWAVYSIAAFFSTVFSEKGRVGMVVGGLMMLMYVLNVISTLKDSLSNLQYGSFFYYFSASGLLDGGEFGQYSILVFVGVASVFTLLAALRFNRRDLAV